MILQKFELCKVQLTHGANQLYIHGNEKLNCLGSTATSRSQIKSFTVCFLYANSSCRLRLPCKGYNSIRTLPRLSAAMFRCPADWAGAPLHSGRMAGHTRYRYFVYYPYRYFIACSGVSLARVGKLKVQVV